MDGFLLACALTMFLGLLLNVRDQRMFLLTAVVGAGFWVPAPTDTAIHYYVFCSSVQALVAIYAWRLRTPAALAVFEICIVLIVADIMGYTLDGSHAFSPYRAVVKILEFSQLAVCVVLSPVLAPILRNRDAPTST